MNSALPETIGKYRIVSKVGQGGMGVVYHAIQEPLDRPCALKILPVEFALNEEYRTRFLREAKTVATIRHDNVVQVYDAGDYEGQYYIAMELVDGCNLLKYLEVKRQISEREGLDLLQQAAKGLAAAHAKGLVHRDIKPENMLLGTDKILRIVDFGLVMESASTTQLTATGACIGTPMYMSPEQADGVQADARTDLYSLGVTFYRVFTGETPFTSPTVMNLLFKHKFEPPRDPRQVRPDLSDDVANLLMHLLAKNREERPQSAQAVVDMIEGLKQGKHVPPPVLSPTPSVLAGTTSGFGTRAPDAHARQALLLTACLMVIVFSAGVWFLFLKNDHPNTVNPVTAQALAPTLNKENWLARGDEAFTLGRYPDALESYKKAQAENPADTQAASKIEKAEKAQKLEDLMQAGFALEAKGDFESAAEKYRAATELDSGTRAKEQLARIRESHRQPKNPETTAAVTTPETAPQTTHVAKPAVPEDPAPVKKPGETVTPPSPSAERDQIAVRAEAARKNGEFELAAQLYSSAASKSDPPLKAAFADEANECRRQEYVRLAVEAELLNHFSDALESYKKALALRSDSVVVDKIAAMQAKLAPPEKLFTARKKIEELVKFQKDIEALTLLKSEQAADPANSEIKSCRDALECLQTCGNIYAETDKIFANALSRLADALDLADDEKILEAKAALRGLRQRFAESAKIPRPEFLAHNYERVTAALKKAKDDAGELAVQLATAADVLDKKAGTVGETSVRVIGVPIGVDRKKMERLQGLAENVRKLVEQAKALRN